MTEPPEPRRPEEGGGEDPAPIEEYDAASDVNADEFFDTDWDQIDRDDQLIDLLHTGNVDISEEAQPSEQAAADVLGRERDRVDREPLPDSTDPDAVIAEFERRKKAAEPPAPRTPISGGTPAMSGPFGELATQFAALKNLVPIEPMHGVETALAELGEAGRLIIGADLAANWTAKIEEVKAQAAATSDMIDGLSGYIEQTAAKIAAGPGNL
jgi:hypothetical protein